MSGAEEQPPALFPDRCPHNSVVEVDAVQVAQLCKNIEYYCKRLREALAAGKVVEKSEGGGDI